jgi:hypothetical protein
MKPFNFEEACAGKPVVDRQGEPVVFTKFRLATPQGHVGMSQNIRGTHLAAHKIDGKASYGTAYDIFMASTVETRYVNLYESPSTHYSMHPNEAAADFYAARHVSCAGKTHNRIGNAIKIEVEV